MVEPLAADLLARLGAQTASWEEFDAGRSLGVIATWPDGRSCAVMVDASGRRPHPSNPAWEQGFPMPDDFAAAVNQLLERRARHG